MSDPIGLTIPGEAKEAILQAFLAVFEPAFEAAVAKRRAEIQAMQDNDLIQGLQRAHRWISNDNVHGMGPSELCQHRAILADLAALIAKHGGAA